MDLNQELVVSGDICLADSATTHTILRDPKYFLELIPIQVKVNTISGPVDLIEGSERASILLPNNTKLDIENALYSHKSRRNLLSFRDIRMNGYHIETVDEKGIEYLCIISNKSGQKLVAKKLPISSSGLYYTTIRHIETHVIES